MDTLRRIHGQLLCTLASKGRQRLFSLQQQKNNQESSMHGPLKLLSYVVILLMLIAMVYSGYISIEYWSGIGV